MEREIYLPFERQTEEKILSDEKREKYWRLMLLAKEARAYPDQSGFFVKTAGMTEDGTDYSGGNKEYAMSDAFIHGETAVVSGLRDMTDSPIEAICWYRKAGEIITPHSFGCPCGNCRDVLRRYCGLNTALINGNETGIVVAQLKDYLFENFRRKTLNEVSEQGVVEALGAREMAIDVYLPEEMKRGLYGAAIVAKDGTIWKGSQYSNCGYDAVTPVLSAVLNWRNTYPQGSASQSHLHLSKLVVAGGAEMIAPFYRDRQAILELDEILRMFKGDNNPLEVEIVKVGEGGVEAYETTVEEWLPHPFSPGAFRMDDVTRAQLERLLK